MADRNIEPWKLTSTHVRFAVAGKPRFPLELARKVAFGIIYFQKAIDDIMPRMTHREDELRKGGWKNCRYAKPNTVMPDYEVYSLSLADLPSIWESIRDAKSLQELGDMMCFAQDRSGRVITHKNWKWNFINFDYHTIEFRQSK